MPHMTACSIYDVYTTHRRASQHRGVCAALPTVSLQGSRLSCHQKPADLHSLSFWRLSHRKCTLPGRGALLLEEGQGHCSAAEADNGRGCKGVDAPPLRLAGAGWLRPSRTQPHSLHACTGKTAMLVCILSGAIQISGSCLEKSMENY